MASRVVTIFEHASLRIHEAGSADSITPREADVLTRIGETRLGFCERGYASVRVAQYCGLVNLGERVLEVLPKIERGKPNVEEGRDLFLRLLHVAGNFPIFEHATASHYLHRAPLLEIFVNAFFSAVTKLIRGGLQRRYITRQEELPLVRGRIQLQRQLTKFANRPDFVACSFDELTIDNDWNRALKAGIRLVRPWIISVELHRRWIELMIALDEVSEQTFTVKLLDRLVVDRQATRYEVSLCWVRWILQLLSPSIRVGSEQAPGLLFNMDMLFQAAVAATLRRAARSVADVRMYTQDATRFLAEIEGPDRRKVFGLRPDLVLRRGTDVVSIGDTKWKRLEPAGDGSLVPEGGDAYQMLAYASAYHCGELVLIYPWHQGLTLSVETAFGLQILGQNRPVLRILCVDLRTRTFALMRGENAPGFGMLFGGTAPPQMAA